MTVYVDDAAIVWRGKARYHMSADSLAELHEFAASVGIKRCWFHRGSAYPHYDVTGEQREHAVQAGAKAVTTRELLPIAKALRKPSKPARPGNPEIQPSLDKAGL